MTLVADKYPLTTDKWGTGTLSWALFGPETEDGDYLYRYGLQRTWDADKPTVAWIMLNPSTADAHKDDPTVRKCRKYAKKWGYGSLIVGNVFGLRSPDPDHLYESENPVGPDNDTVIQDLLLPRSDDVVVAWGNHGEYMDRSREVMAYLEQRGPKAISLNKSGEPSHPLYLSMDSEPFTYQRSAVK